MTNEQIIEKIQSGANKQEYIDLLYRQNEGLISKIANHYNGIIKTIDFEDLRQEGFFGMMSAVENWSPEGGANFSTYAIYWIKASILRYINNNRSSIYISFDQRQKILQYRKAVDSFQMMSGRDPSPLELAEIMDISPREVNEIRKIAFFLDMRSINETISDEESLLLEDTIESATDEIGDVINDIQTEELSSLLWSLVDELSEKESEIIKMRFIDELTLKETGERCGMTAEGVRKHQARAFRKLRKDKNREKLRPFLEDKIVSIAYHSSGYKSFILNGMSAPERAVIYREEKELQKRG